MPTRPLTNLLLAFRGQGPALAPFGKGDSAGRFSEPSSLLGLEVGEPRMVLDQGLEPFEQDRDIRSRATVPAALLALRGVLIVFESLHAAADSTASSAAQPWLYAARLPGACFDQPERDAACMADRIHDLLGLSLRPSWAERRSVALLSPSTMKTGRHRLPGFISIVAAIPGAVRNAIRQEATV